MYDFFIKCSANNFALKAKRKTLSANDVLSALEDMEFEHFVPELKECLEGVYVSICLHHQLLFKTFSQLLNKNRRRKRRVRQSERGRKVEPMPHLLWEAPPNSYSH